MATLLAHGLAAAVVVGAAYVTLVGPPLALNHDELNYLYESLRLPAQGRLIGYAHGPVLYELVAASHLGVFAVLRAVGLVASSPDYLFFVVSHEHAYLTTGRLFSAAMAGALVLAVFRLGRELFGSTAGLLAAVLCACNVTVFTFACLLKEDTLYWLLTVIAMEQALRISLPARGREVAAAVAIAAAAATKYLGVFGFLLVLLPLTDKGMQAGERRRVVLRMLGVSCATLLVLFPMALTDNASVRASILHMHRATAEVSGGLALKAYLFEHLPNLVGIPVALLGCVGLMTAGIERHREVLLLALSPLCQLAFLGLRPGQAGSWYIAPLGLLLIISCCGLLLRVARFLGAPLAALLTVSAVSYAAISSPYLASCLKQAIILSSPDTRQLAYGTLVNVIGSDERVVIANGIRGMNFWGPSLAVVAGRPVNALSAAQQKVAERRRLPRFNVRVVDGDEAPRVSADETWLLWPTVPRVSHEIASLRREPVPTNCALFTEFQARPEAHSYWWPYPTTADYEELRAHRLRELAETAVRGLTIRAYRCVRDRKTESQ
ncbi:MAG TPA: hypothetical protein VMU39_17395 [Solirubrobacteraceae bacterium]|nr:hypothetical protein [Solirubrobacteraceae bacterium]